MLMNKNMKMHSAPDPVGFFILLTGGSHVLIHQKITCHEDRP
jgi:hypothetical protein